MPSYYGKNQWGKALYSQSSTWSLAGGFAPTVTFTGTLHKIEALAGNLAPMVILSAAISVERLINLSGDLAPQVALGASLTGDWVMAGGMAPNVAFAAELTSGPLWATDAPCPPVWGETDPCPPPMWTPEPPPQWQVSGSPGAWGLSQYGIGPYNLQSDDPWSETELCDGG